MLPKILGIDSYIVLAVLGFAAGFALGVVRRKKYGYDIRELVAMLCASIVGIMIGGKLLFIITEIPAVINNNFSSEIIKERVLDGGFVFYGGLLGSLLCIYFLAKYAKSDAGKMLNFAVPCFTLFHAFGRLGCLLQGCCYGIESSFGFATLCGYGEETTRFPVQLVEALSLFAISGILLLIESEKLKEGKKYEILPTYLLLYAPIRFVLEMVRGDLLRGITHVVVDYNTTDGNLNFFFDISTSQIISVLIIAATLLYLLYRYLLAKQEKRILNSAHACESLGGEAAEDTEKLDVKENDENDKNDENDEEVEEVEDNTEGEKEE